MNKIEYKEKLKVINDKSACYYEVLAKTARLKNKYIKALEAKIRELETLEE